MGNPTAPIDPSSVEPLKPIGNEESPTSSFAQTMSKSSHETPGQMGTQNEGKVSPMELANTQGMMEPPSPESIRNQMNSISSSLGDIQNHLTQQNMKLKRSDRFMIKNKLTNALKKINEASIQSGASIKTMPPLSARRNPISQFLALVNSGQQQIASTQQSLEHITANGKSVSPGKMLLIQLKLGKAQQELEFSSVLLGKAVDSIKMMFNIQL